MKTLRWLAPIGATLGIATWLWSETRAAEAPPSTKSSQQLRAQDTQVQARPVLATRTAHSDSTPAPATDAFTDTGVQLKARFAGERVDASWANPTRQQLDADLGKFATSDAHVRAIECRSSLCRVELAVSSRDAGGLFVQSWLHERTFDGPGYVTQSDDGTTVMYLGRPGTELASQ